MKKVMTAEEIFDELDELLVSHAKKILGYMRSPGYKDDLISLCWVAHRYRYFRPGIEPCLTGYLIRESMWSRHSGDSVTLKRDLEDVLEDFISMWDEWRYAFDYGAPQLRAKSGGTKPKRRRVSPRRRRAI